MGKDKTVKRISIKRKHNLYVFPITIEPCKEGGYFAFTPVLKGAHVQGETYAQVIEILEDVIRHHIELKIEHNEFFPFLQAKQEVVANIPLAIRI